jgi:glycosyltransferase involved in cell wall biosynthesis
MISIIIPTLNEEKVIQKTLQSLRSISVPHELIVSDAKSSDKTVFLAHPLADKVVIHDGEHRQTIAEGRNKGGYVASGDILLFLDADCTIPSPETFFPKVLAHFENQNIVALTVPYKVRPEEATMGDRIIEKIVSFIFRISNNVFHNGRASGEFQMMRKSAFEKVGGYNNILVVGEDVDMFTRLSKIGRTYFDASVFIYHTGRRAHTIGWPKLLFLWIANGVSVAVRGKSYSKEWKPIR